MSEDINGDRVADAFNSLRGALPAAREDLVEKLTAAAESADYGAVAELTAALKRIDTLGLEVERLHSEWDSISNPPVFETASSNVPDQYDLCSPTLQALRTLGGKASIREVVDTVIDQMGVPEEVTGQMHEDGKNTELEHQLGWARTILKTCGMVDNPQSGVWVVTELGLRQHWMEPDEIKKLYRLALNQRRQRIGN